MKKKICKINDKALVTPFFLLYIPIPLIYTYELYIVPYKYTNNINKNKDFCLIIIPFLVCQCK